MTDGAAQLEGDYESFICEVGARVRRALVGCYGFEIGSEAAADAISVAWSRRAELAEMENPAGYLFRIGQSKARPMLRWRLRRAAFPPMPHARTSDDAALVDLFNAMGRLRPAERTAILMVKSYGYSYREVAEILGITEASVNNHVRRALVHLRASMEVVP